jgi:hypothetical protein
MPWLVFVTATVSEKLYGWGGLKSRTKAGNTGPIECQNGFGSRLIDFAERTPDSPNWIRHHGTTNWIQLGASKNALTRCELRRFEYTPSDSNG